VLIGLLAAGSPLIVGSYTHLGKPEVFWWGVALLPVYLALTVSGSVAALLWSLLAWCNLSLSVLLLILFGPAALWTAVDQAVWPGLLIGLLPGLLKYGWRGLSIWRSGFLTSLTSDQIKLWKHPWRPLADELSWWLPYACSIGASAFASRQWVVGVLLICLPLTIYWANFRLLYINDGQSFHLAFWVIGLSYAAATHSWGGIIALLVMIYNRPLLCGFPAPLTSDREPAPANGWERRWRKAWQIWQMYPALSPMALPQPAPLLDFFCHIDDGARLLVESDGDPRRESRFRAFWQWSEELLPLRQIDLVNEMYTRMVETTLSDRYLTRFNAEQMSPETMHQLCQSLGVTYVVAHTDQMAATLAALGYVQLAALDLTTLPEFTRCVKTPPVSLTLWRTPTFTTVIDPPTPWIRTGNRLSWSAMAGQGYLVRYRWATGFTAIQQGQSLNIEPVQPFADTPLTFMRITAPNDGPVVLEFHPQWI
jgi:hypothetical protein